MCEDMQDTEAEREPCSMNGASGSDTMHIEYLGASWASPNMSQSPTGVGCSHQNGVEPAQMCLFRRREQLPRRLTTWAWPGEQRCGASSLPAKPGPSAAPPSAPPTSAAAP